MSIKILSRTVAGKYGISEQQAEQLTVGGAKIFKKLKDRVINKMHDGTAIFMGQHEKLGREAQMILSRMWYEEAMLRNEGIDPTSKEGRDRMKKKEMNILYGYGFAQKRGERE